MTVGLGRSSELLSRDGSFYREATNARRRRRRRMRGGRERGRTPYPSLLW